MEDPLNWLQLAVRLADHLQECRRDQAIEVNLGEALTAVETTALSLFRSKKSYQAWISFITSGDLRRAERLGWPPASGRKKFRSYSQILSNLDLRTHVEFVQWILSDPLRIASLMFQEEFTEDLLEIVLSCFLSVPNERIAIAILKKTLRALLKVEFSQTESLHQWATNNSLKGVKFVDFVLRSWLSCAEFMQPFHHMLNHPIFDEDVDFSSDRGAERSSLGIFCSSLTETFIDVLQSLPCIAEFLNVVLAEASVYWDVVYNQEEIGEFQWEMLYNHQILWFIGDSSMSSLKMSKFISNNAYNNIQILCKHIEKIDRSEAATSRLYNVIEQLSSISQRLLEENQKEDVEELTELPHIFTICMSGNEIRQLIVAFKQSFDSLINLFHENSRAYQRYNHMKPLKGEDDTYLYFPVQLLPVSKLSHCSPLLRICDERHTESKEYISPLQQKITLCLGEGLDLIGSVDSSEFASDSLMDVLTGIHRCLEKRLKQSSTTEEWTRSSVIATSLEYLLITLQTAVVKGSREEILEWLDESERIHRDIASQRRSLLSQFLENANTIVKSMKKDRKFLRERLFYFKVYEAVVGIEVPYIFISQVPIESRSISDFFENFSRYLSSSDAAVEEEKNWLHKLEFATANLRGFRDTLKVNLENGPDADIWKNKGEIKRALEVVETFLLRKLYTILATCLLTIQSPTDAALDLQDPERGFVHDEIFRQRLRDLQWLRSNHLEVDLGEEHHHPILWNRVGQELEKLETWECRTARSKLQCLRKTFQWVTESVKVLRNEAHPETDVLCPALIYALVKAVPRNLASSMQFIVRFRMTDLFAFQPYNDVSDQDALTEEMETQIKEEVFCLMQFIGAQSFLMKATYHHFANIDPDHWEAQMNPPYSP